MKNHTKQTFFGIQKKTLFWFFYILILTPICFEIALRIVGADPFIQQDYEITSVPENPFLGDDSLGIVLNSGTYNITLNKKHTFTATHTNNQLRKVYFTNSTDSILPKIAVLGCSFTYGYGVNDDEHFTSILQKKHPKNKFTNYGVIGYGTTHSYIQLKKLEQEKTLPKVIVLNFATDHFNRNVLTNSYRRALKIGFNRSLKSAQKLMKEAKYPITLNTNLEISYEKWNEMYKDWNGRSTFSSINWVQTMIDQLEDNQKKPIEVSFALIKEMDAICKKNNVQFLVSLLDKNESSETLKTMLQKDNIQFLEIGFNFDNKELTNYPYDNHPNKLGHIFIAKKINNTLKTYLANE